MALKNPAVEGKPTYQVSGNGNINHGLEVGVNIGNIIYKPKRKTKESAFEVPDSLSANFVGRSEELAHLDEVYRVPKRNGPTRCIIYGMPGLGKTQLALKFAAINKTRYSFVFWVSATSEDKFKTEFANILDLVDIPANGKQDTKIIATRSWLQSQENWLLIVDNVSEDEDTIRYLRDTLAIADATGHILITTRFASVAASLSYSIGEEHAVWKLGDISLADATRLFVAVNGSQFPSNAVGKLDDSSEMATIEALVTHVDRLPLAVNQAAAYCERLRKTPSDLLGVMYQSTDIAHFYEWKNKLSPYENPSITSTFQPILDGLAQTSTVAYDILQVFAYLDAESISLDMVMKGLRAYRKWYTTWSTNILYPRQRWLVRYNLNRKPQEIRTLVKVLEAKEGDLSIIFNRINELATRGRIHEAMRLLEDLRLLQVRDQRNLTYGMHDLHRDYVRHKTSSSVWRHVALCIVTTACLTIGDLWKVESWSKVEAIVPHIRTLSEQMKGKELPSLRLLITQGAIAQYLRAAGRFDEALKLSWQQLDGAELVLGKTHREALNARYDLAWVCHVLSLKDEAEEHMKKTLKLMKGRFAPDNPTLIKVKRSLAEIYMENERYEDAEDLMDELLQDRAQIAFENRTVDEIRAIGSLASLYYNQQRYDEAEKLQTKTYSYLLDHLGDGDLRTIEALDDLSCTIHAQNRFQDAIKLLQGVLVSRIGLIGLNHPHTRSTIEELREWESHLHSDLDSSNIYPSGTQKAVQILASSSSAPDLTKILASIGQPDESEIAAEVLRNAAQTISKLRFHRRDTQNKTSPNMPFDKANKSKIARQMHTFEEQRRTYDKPTEQGIESKFPKIEAQHKIHNQINDTSTPPSIKNRSVIDRELVDTSQPNRPSSRTSVFHVSERLDNPEIAELVLAIEEQCRLRDQEAGLPELSSASELSTNIFEAAKVLLPRLKALTSSGMTSEHTLLPSSRSLDQKSNTSSNIEDEEEPESNSLAVSKTDKPLVNKGKGRASLTAFNPTTHTTQSLSLDHSLRSVHNTGVESPTA